RKKHSAPRRPPRRSIVDVGNGHGPSVRGSEHTARHVGRPASRIPEKTQEDQGHESEHGGSRPPVYIPQRTRQRGGRKDKGPAFARYRKSHLRLRPNAGFTSHAR